MTIKPRAVIAACVLSVLLSGLTACSQGGGSGAENNGGGLGGGPAGGIGGTSPAGNGGTGATGGVAGMMTGGIGAAGSAGVGTAGSAGIGMAGSAGVGMAGSAGTAMAGSGAGMDMPGDAGDDMPGDEPINVEVMGPHAFDTFTDGASAPEYAEGLVYYPTDSDGPFPAMVLSPGLTADNTDYEVWGRVLASHGFVGLLMQPTSTSDWNTARAADLKAGLGVVKQLNMTGTLAGKIDVANIGFMGHSMGGGGTLIAADEVGDMIQAAIPTQPYAPGGSFPGVSCPILLIAAENDGVATTSSNAFTHYNSIPDSTKKIFLEGAGRDHYFSTDRFEDDFEINARYAVAFLKLYLAHDTRYETYLFGAEHEAYMANDTISRYLSPLLP